MQLRYTKRFFILFIIILFFAGCGYPVFTDNGEKYIKELRNKNSCYEIFSGLREDTYEDSLGNSVYKKYINIRITGCDNYLSYDNVDSNFNALIPIASHLFNTCKNRSEFNGIVLEITTFSESSFVKNYIFEYNPQSKTLDFKNRELEEPIFGMRTKK